MFCIKICFLQPDPSFYRWTRSRNFLPGTKAEKKISGPGAEEKWLGSSTLIESHKQDRNIIGFNRYFLYYIPIYKIYNRQILNKTKQ